MTFKQEYLNWLRGTLAELTPSGYTIKVLEELGAGSISNNKFEIKCYVKFGSATKQQNASDRINHPLIFSIFSEAENFKIAEEVFNLFFLTYSKNHSTLKISDEDNDLWHYYNAPTIQTGFNQIGEYQRVNLIMTGVVSYSKEKIIGVRWFLDDVEIQAVSPQSAYNTEPKTVNRISGKTGKTTILGNNNVFSFAMLLDKSFISSKLRDTAYLGAPYIGTLKVVYTDKTYSLAVRATSVNMVGDNETGDNILNISLMPVEV